MRNMRYLVKKANSKLQEVKNFIEEHEDIFITTNLKLYNIFPNDELQEKYGLDDEEYSDLFYDFCDIEYDSFKEWIREEGIEDTRQYIGRTSSFNILPSCIEIDNRDNVDLNMLVYNMIYNHQNGSNDIDYVLEDGIINMKKVIDYFKHINNNWIAGTIEEFKEDLEYIINDILEDVKKELQDSIRIHEYIKSFKENQVANFDEFLNHEINENNCFGGNK